MNTKKLNVIFMGTPEFSVPALKAIAASGHKVISVYTQPPRPKGRGQQLQKSPVHLCAEELGIPVSPPRSLKKDMEAQATFAALGADVAVVAAYGLILPKIVLDAPRYGCLNIHASLLPRWRGASPIQRAVWAGDRQSGITIMQMEEGLDTGPMIAHDAVDLDDTITTSQLHDMLSAMGAAMIVPVLDHIDDIKPVAQDDALSLYAPMLTKEDGRVDWAQGAAAIDRQIRALNPWPGVWTMANGLRLKILVAEKTGLSGTEKPGMILNRDGIVACGEGALRLLQVQPENARAMDFSAAINGNYLQPGLILG